MKEPILVNIGDAMKGRTRIVSVPKEEAKNLRVDVVMPQPSEEGRGEIDLTSEINQKVNNVIE